MSAKLRRNHCALCIAILSKMQKFLDSSSERRQLAERVFTGQVAVRHEADHGCSFVPNGYAK